MTRKNDILKSEKRKETPKKIRKGTPNKTGLRWRL